MALKHFEPYAEASGACLNLKKSVARIIPGEVDMNGWLKWLQTTATVEICGVYFGQNARLRTELELKNKFESSIQGAYAYTSRSRSAR